MQLYETAFDLALYVSLVAVYRRPRRNNGVVVGLYLVAYPVARFLFEFLRGDPRARLGPLTWAQVVSLALLAVGLSILALSRRPAGNAAA